MSLSIEPERVFAEIQAQAKARDAKLAGAEEMIRKYPGAWWDGGAPGRDAQFDPENASFEFLSYTLSQLVWDNPRWAVTTRREKAQQDVAEAMGFGMNRWTHDSELKTVLQDLAVDFAFCWGVAHTTLLPREEGHEYEDPPLWPQVSRISPWDYGFDHRAPTWRRARMHWHRYRIDKEDLLETARADAKLPKEKREGWLYDAIDSINTARPDVPSVFGSKKRDGPDRHEFEVYEVFLPGLQLPGEPGPAEGFNGTILTLGCSGSAHTEQMAGTEIKPPRPFFGPRWGPYTLFGAYIVPDEPFPLSILCATAGHIEQSTRIAQAVDRQVEAYKRLGLVSSADPTLAKTINQGKNEHTYNTRSTNLDALFREFEIGGTTPGNVAAEQRSIMKRDRALGFAANQRGVTTGDTATDVDYANQAALGRTALHASRYQDGVRHCGKTVAWYNYHTDEIRFALGPEAEAAYAELLEEGEEPWFQGGMLEEGSGVTFDDLGLELDVFSMKRPSEQEEIAKSVFLTEFLQLAPALPALIQVGGDAKAYLDEIGKARGFPNFSKLFPNLDNAAQLASQLPVPGADPEPRLGKDLGIQGLFRSFAPKGTLGGGQGAGSQPAPFSATG